VNYLENSACNLANGSTALNAKLSNKKPKVLVTRPAHQAEDFCNLLCKAGFDPVRCPTVEIAAVKEQSFARQQLQYSRIADVIIFTSANAVRYADQISPLKQLISPKTIVLAIGPATCKVLKLCGVKAKHPEHDFSTSGLLDLPELKQTKGRSIALIKGLNGLTTLPDALLAQGSKIHLVEVYQRQIPANESLLKHLFHTGLPYIISTTSNESLSNLVTLVDVDEHPNLWHIPVIVNSKRGEHLARSLGFCDDVLIASPVGDHGQISTLKAWITQRLTQR